MLANTPDISRFNPELPFTYINQALTAITAAVRRKYLGEGSPGEGSVFHFALPLQTDVAQKDAPGTIAGLGVTHS